MEELHLHPRVAQQGLTAAQAQDLFVVARERLVPFRGQTVYATMALLDWDHRLPTKTFTLHVHVCYTPEAWSRLKHAFERRGEEVAGRDLFPEFDVPDYAGLPADESYDLELAPEFKITGKEGVKLDTIRLVSPWRREIAEEDSSRAVAMVRASDKFREVKERASADVPAIELEAVAWTPPCESGLPNWTLDVWWLTSFDGRLGKGWSFLVDLAKLGDDPVLAAREFAVRAG